jgi:hypothetical protein
MACMPTQCTQESVSELDDTDLRHSELNFGIVPDTTGSHLMRPANTHSLCHQAPISYTRSSRMFQHRWAPGLESGILVMHLASEIMLHFYALGKNISVFSNSQT